jgi:hypothetical protein
MSTAANLARGLLVTGFVWVAAAAQAPAQSAPAETLVIVHANVIDGRANAPLRDATVVVADGRIQSVGHGETPGQQGRVIDLKGHWLLPGFVDAHVMLEILPPHGAHSNLVQLRSHRPGSTISPTLACASSIAAARQTFPMSLRRATILGRGQQTNSSSTSTTR